MRGTNILLMALAAAMLASLDWPAWGKGVGVAISALIASREVVRWRRERADAPQPVNEPAGGGADL